MSAVHSGTLSRTLQRVVEWNFSEFVLTFHDDVYIYVRQHVLSLIYSHELTNWVTVFFDKHFSQCEGVSNLINQWYRLYKLKNNNSHVVSIIPEKDFSRLILTVPS